MRFVLLFFVFFLNFAEKAVAIDYFSGNFSKEDLEAIKSGAQENQSKDVKVEEKKPEAPQNKRQIEIPRGSSENYVAPPKEKEPEVKFFMNDIEGNRSTPRANNEEKKPEKEEVININYVRPVISEAVGGITYCQFGLVFENLSGRELKRLRIKFVWANENNPDEGMFTRNITISNVKNGASDKKFYEAPGASACALISYNSPKAKVESCLVDDLTEVQCAKKIKFNK